MDYDQYIEHRKVLLEISSDQHKSFDKTILAIAYGALAFSLAFSKDLIDDFTQANIDILHLSWYCFAAAAVTTTFSYYISGLAAHREIHLLDRNFEVGSAHRRRQRVLPVAIHALNLLSLFLTVAGISLTVGFAISGHDAKLE